MISVFEHPWLGGLFGDTEAKRLWDAPKQLDLYLAFEAALSEALEASGRVASGEGTAAASAIRAAQPDLGKLRAGTEQDGLPVPELVRQLRAVAGERSVAVHTGSTSQDVLDTALAITLRDVADLITLRIATLGDQLQALIHIYGKAPLMGRTRMQAALPITVAHRIQTWRAPLSTHASAFADCRARVARLQLGGAVGTNAAFGDDKDRIASHMAQTLGLSVAPHVWHADRSAIAEFADRLSGLTGTLGKMGQDIALMSQQGIDEVAIDSGGRSSAMPHKSNPILAELLVTLARFNATQLAGMHHALVHEQERSGAAWMLEWMILPNMALASCRALLVASELAQQMKRIGTPES